MGVCFLGCVYCVCARERESACAQERLQELKKFIAWFPFSGASSIRVTHDAQMHHGQNRGQRKKVY